MDSVDVQESSVVDGLIATSALDAISSSLPEDRRQGAGPGDWGKPNSKMVRVTWRLFRSRRPRTFQAFFKSDHAPIPLLSQLLSWPQWHKIDCKGSRTHRDCCRHRKPTPIYCTITAQVNTSSG
jgi:hypothetical protein